MVLVGRPMGATAEGDYLRQMREVGRALGLILGIVGVIWILQGLDVYFAPRSFMTGDRIWVVWGVLAVLVGGSLLWKGRSRRK